MNSTLSEDEENTPQKEYSFSYKSLTLMLILGLCIWLFYVQFFRTAPSSIQPRNSVRLRKRERAKAFDYGIYTWDSSLKAKPLWAIF